MSPKEGGLKNTQRYSDNENLFYQKSFIFQPNHL